MVQSPSLAGLESHDMFFSRLFFTYKGTTPPLEIGFYFVLNPSNICMFIICIVLYCSEMINPLKFRNLTEEMC